MDDHGKKTEAPVAPAAYNIREFCDAHGISVSLYYEAKHDGWGPREMRVGAKGVRISLEAAAAWRRQMEERARATEAA
jgi:hypothetical protein